MCSRVERHGRAIGRLAVDDVVPPEVATVLHRRLRRRVAEAADHQDVLDRSGDCGDRVVHGGLERHRLAAPPASRRR